MQIKYHKEFVKSYKKRIALFPKLENQFKSQLVRFSKNPKDPLLRDHKLVGKKITLRAFSVTGDIRVVCKVVGSEIWFFNIGSHNQVY